MPSFRSFTFTFTFAVLLALGRPLGAQTTLDRSLLLSGGWVGVPGSVQINTPFRFNRAVDAGMLVVPTFELTLGLPSWSLIGARYAPQSQIVPRRADEWEVFGRYKALAQQRGMPVDVSWQAGYNGAAKSVDGEVSLARWFGPLRVLSTGRLLWNAYDSGGTRAVVAGGAVLHPMPRTMPVAVTADIATLLDRQAGEKLAWSASLQLGIPFTVNTASLFATNTGSNTLQGVSRGTGSTRFGFELTVPMPLGRFVGWYVPREDAASAVRELDAPASQARPTSSASIYGYSFLEDRIVIPIGGTIEWTNHDAMVHTVAADDASWNSGAIQPGATWRATFGRAGMYPFHCGPHPFMKGVVIVRS